MQSRNVLLDKRPEMPILNNIVNNNDKLKQKYFSNKGITKGNHELTQQIQKND